MEDNTHWLALDQLCASPSQWATLRCICHNCNCGLCSRCSLGGCCCSFKLTGLACTPEMPGRCLTATSARSPALRQLCTFITVGHPERYLTLLQLLPVKPLQLVPLPLLLLLLLLLLLGVHQSACKWACLHAWKA